MNILEEARFFASELPLIGVGVVVVLGLPILLFAAPFVLIGVTVRFLLRVK